MRTSTDERMRRVAELEFQARRREMVGAIHVIRRRNESCRGRRRACVWGAMAGVGRSAGCVVGEECVDHGSRDDDASAEAQRGEFLRLHTLIGGGPRDPKDCSSVVDAVRAPNRRQLAVRHRAHDVPAVARARRSCRRADVDGACGCKVITPLGGQRRDAQAQIGSLVARVVRSR